MSSTDDPRTEGLRERKKRATRASLQRVALTFFSEKGYRATTMEEIAQAADVSLGTLFNYFPTKPSLVTDDYDPLFIPLLRSRPQGEPLFTAVRRALELGMADIVDEERDLLIARAKLVSEVPELRAAALLDQERSVELLEEILAERCGGDPEFDLKVASAIICSAMGVAMQEWLSHSGESDLIGLVSRALEIVESGWTLDA